MDRALDRPLYLAVQRILNNSDPVAPKEFLSWDLPTAVRREGETMRQVAERALAENCGQGLEAQVLGNAPWGYYKLKYPKSLRTNVQAMGEKVRRTWD